MLRGNCAFLRVRKLLKNVPRSPDFRLRLKALKDPFSLLFKIKLKMTQLDVESLIQELTLNEKVQLLSGSDFWHTTPVRRLGIPKMRLSDGPNGVRGTKFFNGVPTACFPCGTGLGATFDKELLKEAGSLMADEAKAKAASVVLGPTANIARGPNGGRGFESFGEDPVVNGLSSAAMINGLQGKYIAATMKHYVCNDLEMDRNCIDAQVSHRALREVYLLPFQIAVRDANPRAIMTAYNKANGEHVSQSKFLLDEVLRKEWGWDGLLMSDWFGVYDAKSSITNGLDLEMPGPPQCRVHSATDHAINSGEIHINDVDERVRSLLSLINYCHQSGVTEEDPETSDNNTPETIEKLRKISRESIVLLKDDDRNRSILPLKKSDKIAVIGNNAKQAAYCGGGSASVLSYHTTTPFDSIKSRLEDSNTPAYTIGADAYKNLPPLGPQMTDSDGKPGFDAKFFVGSPTSKDRKLIDHFQLTNSQVFLVDYYNEQIPENKEFYVDVEGQFIPEEDGTYNFGLTVFGTGRLFVDDKLVSDSSQNQTPGDSFFGLAAQEVIGSIHLVKGKAYKIKVLYGSSVTRTYEIAASVAFEGGAFTFGAAKQRNEDEEIARAVEIAKANDKVVLCIGLNQDFESEGFDRPDIKIPGATNKMVSAVLKANPNTVIVNQTGTPVEMPWASDAPVILQAWFGGSEAGTAIADVLFGDYNPSGKLTVTFPLRFEDNPAYLNFQSNKQACWYGEDVYVGYRYYETIDRPVLFPFGHGLSFTEFDFTDMFVRLEEENLEVEVVVRNTGKYDGAEVVQLYVAPVSPSLKRPIKELKEYAKIFLASGEAKTVHLSVPIKYATSFFDEYQKKWCSEKGEYTILLGSSSADIKVSQSITLEKTTFWKGL